MSVFSKILDYKKEHDEKAVPIEFELAWNESIPAPYIKASGARRFLALRICTESGKKKDKITLIEFVNCRYIRFGNPNDKNRARNSFYRKELRSCSAHIVENSKWMAKIKKINGTSQDFNPDCWVNSKHYILTFTDITFECIADGYKIKRSDEVVNSRLWEVKDYVQSGNC